jgi:hypothetical protein
VILKQDLTYAEWREQWEAMSEAQRGRVREKAQWEHMSLWSVLNHWPSLRIVTEAEESA